MMPVPCGGKVVLILCGPSGAGKSTWAGGFDATHCSADDVLSDVEGLGYVGAVKKEVEL